MAWLPSRAAAGTPQPAAEVQRRRKPGGAVAAGDRSRDEQRYTALATPLRDAHESAIPEAAQLNIC